MAKKQAIIPEGFYKGNASQLGTSLKVDNDVIFIDLSVPTKVRAIKSGKITGIDVCNGTIDIETRSSHLINHPIDEFAFKWNQCGGKPHEEPILGDFEGLETGEYP